MTNESPAGTQRRSAASLTPERRDELEWIVAAVSEIGHSLADMALDLDGALETVAAARHHLDLVERQLVRLARDAGRTWAQIGVQLGIGTASATHERFDRER